MVLPVFTRDTSQESPVRESSGAMEFGGEAHNSNQVRIITTLSLMVFLSTAIFLLRLLARRISVARYWYDDYMAFVALVRFSRIFRFLFGPSWKAHDATGAILWPYHLCTAR